MNRLYTLIFLLSLCLGAFSQEITVRFTGLLNGTDYCRLDSVAITNLTRDWTETIEYPDTIIVPGSTVWTNQNIVTMQGLGQNVPNPFDCETRVELSVSQRENVRMQLLDASGKQYAEYSGSLDAGVHTFDISAATPQTYILNAVVGDKSYSIRMVNTGSGCGSSIKYAGISGSITAKLTRANEFQNGDNMRYVGYTTIEGEVVASTAVEQAQTISEVITLNFTHCINTFGTDIQSACDSYTWIDGVTYTESTNEPTFTLTNAAGCDSIVTLNLTINRNAGIDTQSACESYTWINGETYTESTTEPIFTLTNVAGCDSVVTLHLTINHSTTGTDEQTVCDSYTWIDGVTYTESTTGPTFTLTNAAGCDSVVTLHLTINHSNTSIDEQTACDSYTWIDGITYTESTNEPTFTLTNAFGCDSVVTLHLTINRSSTDIDEQTACESYTWINGVTYTESTNEPTFTLTNAAGCDSIVTLNLTISHNAGIDTQSACESYTWINGETYTESTTEPTFTLTNAAGCDSVVTLHLTINHSNTGIDEQTACESYTWIDNVTYTESTNEPTFTLTNAAGCDSVVTLHLTITCQPTVQTIAVTDITIDGATLYGDVISDGGATITVRGFLYGTSENNLTEDVQSGNGTGSFTANLTDLTSGTTYYYKAYATNNEGTAYGEVLSFTTLSTTGTQNGHDWVDLGLPSGARWATCNVGADTPEGYGNYYAWGETTTKDYFSESNYQFYMIYDSHFEVTAYCGDPEYCDQGLDNLTTLQSEDDAATANWGRGWRMPTYELNELKYNCTETWTTQNGVSGLLFTGPNGNSIFLPSLFESDDDSYYSFYWSSSLCGTLSAYLLYISKYENDFDVHVDSEIREEGYFVRAICPTGGNITIVTPIVTTGRVNNITANGAKIYGEIPYTGGDPSVSRGFLYGTSESNLTQSIQSGTGGGSFSTNLTDLTPVTTYYYKAYATNSAGTAYGEVRSFTTRSVPTVQTCAATSISPTEATLSGKITSNGGASVTARGFLYGTNVNDLTLTVQSSSGTSIFTANLSDLTSGTTYYYKAYATSSAGTGYGEVMSFTTLSVPTVQTNAATNITADGATLSGNVTSDGGATVTDRGFLYGTSESNLTQTIQSGSGTGRFTAPLSNQTYGTTYYYKAYATNIAGTAYGEVMSFTTNSSANVPTVQTNAATSITDKGATLSGDIISNGGATITERGFMYGTDASSLTHTVQSGSGNGNFTKAITGLTISTTYYYKAYATNSEGTSYGAVKSFTTLPYSSPTGYSNGHGYVDLGLPSGIKWATLNLDAGSPDEFGNYFAWGEIYTKGTFTTDNYIGYTGSNLIPFSEDFDAATLRLGREWRMPTSTEMHELIDNCTNTGMTINGTNGCLFTGPNGNSIFLPAAGYYDNRTLNYGQSSGFYWSRNGSTSPSYAKELTISSGGLGYVEPNFRYYGQSIRAVCECVSAPYVNTGTATDITYMGATISGNVISSGGASITERGFLYGTSESDLTQTVQSGSGMGSFTANLTGLSSSTTYYYKAYATNSFGTSYGEIMSFTTLATTGTLDGHDWVDLGLPSGTRWATCNIGATAPEDYGNYYAWGETSIKITYDWSTYSYCDGNYDRLNKYCTNSTYGSTDNLTTLEVSDDAATAKWDSGWRMPTYDEMLELNNNCTVTWTTRNGVNGRLFTGPNGNSIFLPAAGYKGGSLYDAGSKGYYWSKSLQESNPYEARHLYATSSDYGMWWNERKYGQSVRAVCECVSAPIVNTTTATDITYNTAALSGKVIFFDGATVTARGFLYGTSENNLTEDVQSGSGIGSYTANITGLTSGTTYYYKAYATNSEGTVYGEVLSFTTLSTTLNGHDWVDLGLPSGTRWATCNVGAGTPEAYGDYFAWGETSSKTTYSWSNYRYCNGSSRTLTKYCNDSRYGNNGFTDNLTTLEASDDAATANWGSGWRMPTYNELNELKNNCTVTCTTQNGVNGCLFTGPNGNSIFIPAAGSRRDSEIISSGCYYWSNLCPPPNTDSAWYLYSSGSCSVDCGYRCTGRSVRAVCMPND